MSNYGTWTEPTRSPLDRDRLHMVPRTLAAKAAHEALFSIQDLRPDVLVAGVAVLFAALVARCGMDPQEMHLLGLRILRDPDEQLGGDKRNNASLQSLRDFAGIRIMGERNVSIG